MTEEERVTPAPVGREVPLRYEDEVVTYVVKESCGSNNGRWHCATHSRGFLNQLEKDMHIGAGEHELAWICYIDGNLETP